MKKFISSSTVAALTTILFICGISFFVINACRKMDRHNQIGIIDPVQKFFKVPANTHASVKKIIEKIRNQNQQAQFLGEFIKRQGFAIWDKAIVKIIPFKSRQTSSPRLTGDSTRFSECILIPLVLENGNQVHGALACKVDGDSIYMKLIDGADYASYNYDSPYNRA